jgi:hypothetical protein
MDDDCMANPDFCDWVKVYIPYCTGDMHSGTQMERNAALGGFYFSGHNLIAGVAAHLTSQFGNEGMSTPSDVLVVGSSAGGIAALMHTDYFGEQWPTARVKGAPMCGFFYAGVTAMNDLHAGVPTPADHLGFIPDWKPYLPSACAAATNNNMSVCTDAHYLYPYLKQPLFVRENQYDTAKLANCGWDGTSTEYLQAWGKWMRAQLMLISRSTKDGFFSGSCLQHGGNFGWESSPVINGVHMRDAISNWFFDKGDVSMQYTFDNCSESGGTGLPCTLATGMQSCPHLHPGPIPPSPPSPGPPTPLSPECRAELEKDCPGQEGKGEACGTCVRAHALDLKGNRCPDQYQPVYGARLAAHDNQSPPSNQPSTGGRINTSQCTVLVSG